VSLGFLGGVAVATSAGVAIAWGLAAALGRVGVHLEQSDSGYAHALPFIALTVLVAAIPLLARLLFHRRAESAAPAVRGWVSTHGWLVNIIACAIFIILILA
jgi:hypothetical protein